ncbi:hypothetical protein HNQ80_001467 [Anaerosolibacter carboniphilus]|uniref:DUF2809 domain-containing protein n=1 Tax=Anaerosolibacter carboniphilus TaxID=1417629 RepID=A0A841KT97_9FIRM|nr:DUF2809 domain-containing protein [Anaerosolibacter carboniphilus]MBB6215378.1 hypothetical protein [Anaerosolibacter carboniphilus]
MKINKKYLFTFLILLIIEIIIALFVNDTIIRPLVGDILVVILMYTFIRGFISKSIKLLPLYLFLFAAAVEMAQYFHIVDLLNLRDNKLISTIIGTTFDQKDILCYLIAAVILFIWEKLEKR